MTRTSEAEFTTPSPAALIRGRDEPSGVDFPQFISAQRQSRHV